MTELSFWLGKGSIGDVDFIHGHLIFFLFIPHQDQNHPFENIFFSGELSLHEGFSLPGMGRCNDSLGWMYKQFLEHGTCCLG